MSKDRRTPLAMNELSTELEGQLATTQPVLRLLPQQRVAGSDQIAPLQYKLPDAARLLAVSERTLQRWIKTGRASATGRRKLRRMEYAEILRLLEELRREGEVT